VGKEKVFSHGLPNLQFSLSSKAEGLPTVQRRKRLGINGLLVLPPKEQVHEALQASLEIAQKE
jgi:hypothetical protein